MHDAHDDVGAVVQEPEVGFDGAEVGGGDGPVGPEERVVVGEEGEYEAEEEGRCCWGGFVSICARLERGEWVGVLTGNDHVCREADLRHLCGCEGVVDCVEE